MSPTALRNVVPTLTAGMEITLPMKRVGELGESTTQPWVVTMNPFRLSSEARGERERRHGICRRKNGH